MFVEYSMHLRVHTRVCGQGNEHDCKSPHDTTRVTNWPCEAGKFKKWRRVCHDIMKLVPLLGSGVVIVHLLSLTTRMAQVHVMFSWMCAKSNSHTRGDRDITRSRRHPTIVLRSV